MDLLSRAESWLCDMDGVLIRDGSMVEGADRFLAGLTATGRPFLVLTNNSLFTPREIRTQLAAMGLDVNEEQLWTSALATAKFVNSQRPAGSAYVIGEASLHEALADVGYREDDQHPDYVVLGETENYSYDSSKTAATLSRRTPNRPASRPRDHCPESVPSRQ
jgi:NagD protein